jgi:hypothetical protein
VSGGVYTTTVDVLGDADGTPALDEWGDPIEGVDVLLAAVPALITERRTVVATESDPQAVTVHYYTGRLPAGTVVTRDQRIRTPDGVIYVIDYVNATPTSPAVPADVRLDLRRVT